jgi:WD40 repeat protein
LAKLRLLPAGAAPAGQTGEALCCAYTPDGTFALSGGWDGHLRLWESAQGAHVSSFPVSDKPVSACTVSPDGKTLAAGSLDGMLSLWDSVAHHAKLSFAAHTRPISSIAYGVDNRNIATTSWDNSISVWVSLQRHEARTLAGHRDIVAGCRYTPDGAHLLSWSHDCTVYLWDLSRGRPQHDLVGHTDKVLAGGIAPDGNWAVTGARDGEVKLWNLEDGAETASASLREEIRGCFFLLDGSAVVAVDKNGRLVLLKLPDLRQQSELVTRLSVQCAALSPTGNQIAVACNNGRVRFIAVDGVESSPLLVGVTRTGKRVASPWQKLFGKSSLVYSYQCTCPACRQTFDLPQPEKGQDLACAHCKHQLRFSGAVRNVPEKQSGAG